MDHEALRKAIYAKLSGSALNTEVSGKLAYRKPEPSWETPFVLFDIITSNPVDRVFENTLVQFHIFDHGATATKAEAIHADLRALYDDCALSATGLEPNLGLEWDSGPLDMSDYTDDGVWVWHLVVDYRVWIER